jgi:uncharacterized protein (TIGR03435 family)
MRLSGLFTLAVFAPGLAISDGPTFDAASVKLTGPDVKPPYLVTGGPGTNDPGRFHAPRVKLLNLLTRAFDVSSDQIAGPAWLRDFASNNYTVDAVIPPNTTKEQFQQMLQNLLVERFHLVFHHETRKFPGYELVVDKGGPKFKEVTPTPEADPTTPADRQADMRAVMSAPKGADGFPAVPGSRTFTGGNVLAGQMRTKYQEQTMAQFVSTMGSTVGVSQGKSAVDGYLQPRVVDKTGLTGTYTFILEYYDAALANAFARLPSRANSDPSSVPAASDPGGTSNIFTAIQKQLGLRLDKVADVPLDVIVVDSVDKVPTAN